MFTVSTKLGLKRRSPEVARTALLPVVFTARYTRCSYHVPGVHAALTFSFAKCKRQMKAKGIDKFLAMAEGSLQKRREEVRVAGVYCNPRDGACLQGPGHQRLAPPQGSGFLHLFPPTSKEFAKLNATCSSPRQTQRAREEIFPHRGSVSRL